MLLFVQIADVIAQLIDSGVCIGNACMFAEYIHIAENISDDQSSSTYKTTDPR
jgi:hypothetical protein